MGWTTWAHEGWRAELSGSPEGGGGSSFLIFQDGDIRNFSTRNSYEGGSQDGRPPVKAGLDCRGGGLGRAAGVLNVEQELGVAGLRLGCPVQASSWSLSGVIGMLLA